MIYILVFLAGIFLAGMQSFNGLLSNEVGLLGTSLAVHLIGGLLLILYILVVKKQRIKLFPMPWYLYSAGLLGLILVSCTSVCVLHIGAAFTTCLSIAGQLFLSILIDHFGFFGFQKVTFQKRRIPTLLLIACGLSLIYFNS